VLITSLSEKPLLSLFVIEMLYRHESPLSLTPEPTNQSNQGQEVPKYQQKRGKHAAIPQLPHGERD
jgi:hypothetical protein